MNTVLEKAFQEMSQLEIQWIMLRGYLPINEIDESLDIDLYVHPKDKERIHQLLKDLGWYAPQMNVNKFPHKQYYYFTPEKTLKLDIVFDLYFGKEYMKLTEATAVFQTKRELVPFIYTANPYDSITIFLLHVVFDKGVMSKENLLRLQRMYEDTSNSLGQAVYGDLYKLLLPYILKIISGDTRVMEDIRDTIANTSTVKRCRIRAFVANNKLRIMSRAAKVRNMICKKSICLIGVDGAGKSSTVEELKDLMREKVTVQYMGFRGYEGKWASKYNNYMPKGVIPNFICTVIVYFEMWKRFLRNRFDSEQIVLFDRFVNESYINATGPRKAMTKLLFGFLFPRPRRMYYLHCEVKTSLHRKDDILDTYQFENMKNNFDSLFLKKPNVKTFDSDTMTSDEIAKAIYQDLIQEIPEFLI